MQARDVEAQVMEAHLMCTLSYHVSQARETEAQAEAAEAVPEVCLCSSRLPELAH